MRNPPLESRVRENRTHGSEGGEGESPSLPLSGGGGSANTLWIPAYTGMTGMLLVDVLRSRLRVARHRIAQKRAQAALFSPAKNIFPRKLKLRFCRIHY